MLNVEVRIVDDEMNDVAPGEIGEIVYLGPLVMEEYWNRPVETAEAFRGGWFHSAIWSGRTATATFMSSTAGKT